MRTKIISKYISIYANKHVKRDSRKTNSAAPIRKLRAEKLEPDTIIIYMLSIYNLYAFCTIRNFDRLKAKHPSSRMYASSLENDGFVLFCILQPKSL